MPLIVTASVVASVSWSLSSCHLHGLGTSLTFNAYIIALISQRHHSRHHHLPILSLISRETCGFFCAIYVVTSSFSFSRGVAVDVSTVVQSNIHRLHRPVTTAYCALALTSIPPPSPYHQGTCILDGYHDDIASLWNIYSFQRLGSRRRGLHLRVAAVLSVM